MEVSQLNEKQKAALEQFREAVSDCQLKDSSDRALLRWLAARTFDPVQAEKMLRHSLEWRRANQVDAILDAWQPPEVLVKYFPAGLIGTDKFGFPLWLDPFGRADVQGLLAAAGKRDYLRYLVYLAEKSAREMERLSEEKGRPITLQTCIMDMEHMQLRQMTTKAAMDVAVESSKIMESHYPESLRRIYIINAPKIFTMVFAMFKPFMDQLTIDKIRIYGTNRDEWTQALLQDIDADQLPKFYGGTMTDPDGNPMCLSKVCMGGEVPKSYYLTKPQALGGMQFFTLPKKSRKQLELEPENTDVVLRWQFMSEDGDLGFRVYYTNGKEKVDVVPFNRVDCHLVMEEGRIVCTHAAKYVFEFDNGYSWTRAKNIWYLVELERPDSETAERDASAEAENVKKSFANSSI